MAEHGMGGDCLSWMEDDTLVLSITDDGLTMTGRFGPDGMLQGDWIV